MWKTVDTDQLTETFRIYTVFHSVCKYMVLPITGILKDYRRKIGGGGGGGRCVVQKTIEPDGLKHHSLIVN